jgi:2-keto-4-pentenoate hydratase/2-oxohepta-3-ene-1,7-dioic acid hydratase in catechol pathway
LARGANISPFLSVNGSSRRLRVGKIVCVGRNYRAHLEEMGYTGDEPPVLFLKPATALLRSGGTLTLPAFSRDVQHEVELVAVIGRETRAIPQERALSCVMGYAVGLDLTCRDLQAAAKRSGEPWAVSKGFDGAAPMSSVTPARDVGDPGDLAIELRVNGEVRQSARTSLMIHGVAWLVAFASSFMTLEPGDLLMTGTPSGVGPLRAGDVVTGSVERVGIVEIHVADPAPPGLST